MGSSNPDRVNVLRSVHRMNVCGTRSACDLALVRCFDATLRTHVAADFGGLRRQANRSGEHMSSFIVVSVAICAKNRPLNLSPRRHLCARSELDRSRSLESSALNIRTSNIRRSVPSRGLETFVTNVVRSSAFLNDLLYMLAASHCCSPGRILLHAPRQPCHVQVHATKLLPTAPL